VSLTVTQAQNQGRKAGLDSLDVDVLLTNVLKKNRTFLFAWPENELTENQEIRFNEFLVRRISGEPIAYIIGQREFWSLPLTTEASTLIPRPDTEVLVEAVLSRFNDSPKNCVDLGTGTGAIALALKSERASWKVTGVDRITEAVLLSRKNAKDLKIDVDFFEGNWCDSLSERSIDILVSNPPYIDENDHHLDEGDVRFEPRSALVAGDNGLSDIQIITLQAKRCLVKNGALFFEHGWKQGAQVRDIMRAAEFEKIETIKDYGGNDRITFGYLIN